MEEKIRARK